jgi:hypothetical protein
MADRQHLCAAVVSVCDNCVSGHGRSAQHRSRYLFGPFERNSSYRGSATAKKSAERTCPLGGCDHMWKKTNQFRAEWLVKVV